MGPACGCTLRSSRSAKSSATNDCEDLRISTRSAKSNKKKTLRMTFQPDIAYRVTDSSDTNIDMICLKKFLE